MISGPDNTVQNNLPGEDVSREVGKKCDKRERIIGRESSVLSRRRAISSRSALMHSLSNYHSTLWYSGSFIFCRGKWGMAVWSQRSIVKEGRVPSFFSGRLKDQSQARSAIRPRADLLTSTAAKHTLGEYDSSRTCWLLP